MADIRINALATTAASTASDDFVAVDGSANGTRKLNAFSPTFGGNLTVSSSTASTSTTTGALVVTGGVGVGGAINAGSYVKAGGDVYVANGSALILDTGITNYMTGASGTGVKIYSSSALAATFAGANTTLAGNLTVSGTGTSTFGGKIQTTSSNGIEVLVQSGNTGFAIQSGTTQYSLYLNAADNSFRIYSSLGGDRLTVSSGGNFLLGTTTDSGNGKLQLATHTTSAGGIGFGSDTSLFRVNNGRVAVNGTSAGVLYFYEGGAEKGYIGTAAGDLYVGASTAKSILLQTNGTTALTLDSSQNATFAGFATVSKKTTTVTQSSVVIGNDLAISTGSGRSKMTLGSTDSTSEILIGQTATNSLVLQWEYAATVANARAILGTYGYSNPIAVRASSITLETGGSATTALTLDSSQRCILAGALRLNNAYTAGAPTATGYVTIQDSAGNTYKVLVGT